MTAFSCTRTISTSVCNSNLIIPLDNCRLELWKHITFFSLLLRRKWKPEGSTWWRFYWWDHLQLSLLALITAYKFRHKELFSLNNIPQTEWFFHPAAARTDKMDVKHKQFEMSAPQKNVQFWITPFQSSFKIIGLDCYRLRLSSSTDQHGVRQDLGFTAVPWVHKLLLEVRNSVSFILLWPAMQLM